MKVRHASSDTEFLTRMLRTIGGQRHRILELEQALETYRWIVACTNDRHKALLAVLQEHQNNKHQYPAYQTGFDVAVQLVRQVLFETPTPKEEE